MWHGELANIADMGRIVFYNAEDERKNLNTFSQYVPIAKYL